MVNKAQINSATHGVKLYDLKCFLRSKGWEKIQHPNRKYHAFRYNSQINILLPAFDKYIDTNRKIADAISVLSTIYNINTTELINQLSNINVDKVFLRLIQSDTNSIPIETARKDIQELRNLFVYSASSEQKALPHFEQPLSEGHRISQNCMFGHTFKGSFGFSIETPVIVERMQTNLFEPPFERKVIERIVRGLIVTEDAVNANNPDILISRYKDCFNSKMCDAIVGIGEASEVPIEFSIGWATSLSPSNDLKNYSSKIMDEREFELLKQVSVKLKEIEPKDRYLTGFVTQLHCASNPNSDERKRTIILKFSHEEHGMIEVKIILDKNSYIDAIDAHKSGKMIVVRGELGRKGNTWFLNSPSDLKKLK